MHLGKILEELVREKAPGPLPSFTTLHILKTLELIATKGPLGRSKLSEELGVGEGVTRTIIERLKNKGITAIQKEGCVLTDEGKKVWANYSESFPKKIKLERNELTLSDFNMALLVKNRGGKVSSGMEQRDAAVRAGAKTATTLVARNNKLTIPMVSSDVAKDFANANSQLTRLFRPDDNDVIVICGADDWKKAEYGLLAASLTFIEENCG